jgi:uncharacterized protein (TIGR00730 family)
VVNSVTRHDPAIANENIVSYPLFTVSPYLRRAECASIVESLGRVYPTCPRQIFDTANLSILMETRMSAKSTSSPVALSASHPSHAPTNHATAKKIRSICVYCGSGGGRGPMYLEAAETLGRMMAEQGIRLVYGGGGLGLMGEVATSVLKHGGYVTGIIPEFLSSKEKMLRDVQELIVVEDMHQRKKLMFERSDAFVALPGGIGTLEELVEQLTWAQLGRHDKPIVLANIGGFWQPFLTLLGHMRDEKFIREGLEVRFVTVDRAEQIVAAAQAAAAPLGHTDAATTATLQQF